MGRRSQLEIRLCMLKAINSGIDKPTRIMYASNMSWKPTQKILSHLVEQGLVSEVNNPQLQSRRRYKITEKGKNVIKYFEDAGELLQI